MKKIKKKLELNKYVIFFVFIVLCFVSIGFSAFQHNLLIDSMKLTVRVKADIRVTGISEGTGLNGGVVSYYDYDVKSIVVGGSLPNNNSELRFKVQVTNFDGPEMGILSITGPDYLEVITEEYEYGDKICDNNKKCSLGVQKEFYVIIKYKDGANVQTSDLDLTFNFDFRPFHKVTYTGLDVNGNIEEIIDGGTLEVNLPNDIDLNSLSVLMGSNIIEYTSSGNKITIENVTNDVEIVYGKLKTPVFAFMSSKSEGTDKDFDFYDETKIQNGVFMHEETKDEKYPVYYYRGEVSNNAIYANYCWKIVRTTENGGLKLVYSGEVSSNGECVSDHDYLGSEAYNNKIEEDGVTYASPHQVGYKYEKTIPIKMIVPSYLNDTNKILDVGTIFGHDVEYDANSKKYILKNYTAIDDLNEAEDIIRGGNVYYGIGYHYTCLTTDTSCEKVYYIYFNDYGNSTDTRATGLFGVELTSGLNVVETLDEILYNSSNSIDSHAKSYLDQFFQGIGSDYKRAGGDPLISHLTELDDVQWCNDRTVAGYHGWDIDNDNHSSDNKYLHFAAFGRLVGDDGVADRSRPDIKCDSVNDSFTVNNEKGNKSLTYPIAMLDADEAVLAGAMYQVKTDNYLKLRTSGKAQFLMAPFYLSDDHTRMFILGSDGKLSSGYASDDFYAIRPAIALKGSMFISDGDGTQENPYKIEK